MDDCHLKPPMLRSVVRDHLPDEKRPFPSPADLVGVLSHVRAHGLLSEQQTDTTERKLVEDWRTAVDGWVEYIVSLASSKTPDKCWAGVCFLGLTCEACCADRFESSYTIWFPHLLENIQSPSSTHIVKVACCSSLSDLFTRLSHFPNLKKDGTLYAGKLTQPILQLLNEDVGETICDAAASLLCTLLSFFPSSMQRHYETIEAVITSKIMAAKCNLNTHKKFGNVLALLPKVKGNEDSWCLTIQKILIAINSILTDVFQGFEEEKKFAEIMKMIVPSGKIPPPPLGGETLPEEVYIPATRRLHDVLVPKLTTLMHCLCIMLTNPYPLQVVIPIHSLLATVRRVLQVDGSFNEALFLLTTSMHHELLCAELPTLHVSSLDLLIAIIKSLRRQLLPHGINLARLLTEYSRRARLPSIRTKVYSIIHMLLISMGAGMSLYLAQEVVNNAFSDLNDYLELGNSSMLLNKQPSTIPSKTFQKNHRRKRKHGSLMSLECHNGDDIRIKNGSNKQQTPLSVQIAALKALEALLTVGGSLNSKDWRPSVDFLVVTVATNACRAGWANEVSMSVPEDVSSSFVDFQLAALEALLASLLSGTKARPPFLSQGLDLFHRGRQETGTKLAAFCAHALLSLEILIHPRALPLMDQLPQNPSFDEGISKKISTMAFNNDIKSNFLSIPKDDLGLLDVEEEELSNHFLDMGDEQISADDKHTETIKRSSKFSEDITRNSSAAIIVESKNKMSQNVDAEMECLGRDEMAVDGLRAEQSRCGISSCDVSDDKLDFERRSSPILASETAPGKGDCPLGTRLNLTAEKGVSPKRSSYDLDSNWRKVKDVVSSYDSDFSSMDSLPDIVDGDPESE
ncbi:hypothetical protein KSP39_PZI016567 [Platanthera zijinensis]|uniref:Pre-rRNA-processing protein RIX1 N-terminal domain-containing protein n=1 Tax=Platanthera zijinensis TaxID=2320716 RepID=A0AAP0G180_9ASPA